MILKNQEKITQDDIKVIQDGLKEGKEKLPYQSLNFSTEPFL